MKVIDDGQGEDVTNGEGVNVKDLGDGEADIGDDDFFFRFLSKGITFSSLSVWPTFSCFCIHGLVYQLILKAFLLV